jgi:hypothetical protein
VRAETARNTSLASRTSAVVELASACRSVPAGPLPTARACAIAATTEVTPAPGCLGLQLLCPACSAGALWCFPRVAWAAVRAARAGSYELHQSNLLAAALSSNKPAVR